MAIGKPVADFMLVVVLPAVECTSKKNDILGADRGIMGVSFLQISVLSGTIVGMKGRDAMKKKRIRSAWPIYIAAAVFALYAARTPMYTGKAMIWAVIWSALAYLISERFFFKGREVEVESRIDTGDKDIDRQIEEGRAQLKAIQEKPAGDAQIDNGIARMYEAGMKVFEAVAQKPEKAQQVRRFMNYYLPTTSKLMQHYFTLREVGGHGEHVTKALGDIRNNIGMIADAFEKQLDNLYRAEAIDVSSDIDVMEAMIAADGLTDDGVRKIMKEDEKK